MAHALLLMICARLIRRTNAMACSEVSVAVGTTHYEFSGHRYTQSICRVDNLYYASWLCLTCFAGEISGRVRTQEAANACGLVAIKKHHASYQGKHGSRAGRSAARR